MQSQKSKIKKFRLKNGMSVLLNPSSKAPVVSVQVWVRTGSADEPIKYAGISHFIEHLLFKGTKKYANGEIANIVEMSGGEMNAYTSFDQTVFYITLPKHNLPRALDVLSDMMGWPEFLAEETDREREVVIEEIKMGEDSPSRKASQLFFETAYKGHTYGVPVIGFTDVIRKISPGEIRKYYAGRYNPKNMFVVVAGEIDLKKTPALIQKTFGQMPNPKFALAKRPKFRAPKEPRIVVQSSNFQRSLAYLSWPTPPVHHIDNLALELAAHIFGQGDSSRLVDRLRIREPLVLSVSSGLFEGIEAGQFIVSFQYMENKLETILKLIRDEISHLLDRGITQDELNKAKFVFQSEQFFARETVDGLARQNGHFQFYFGNPEEFTKALKRVEKMALEEVNAALRKYLDPKKITFTLLTNQKLEDTEKTVRFFVKQLMSPTKAPSTRPSSLDKRSKPRKTNGYEFKDQTINGVRSLFVPLKDTEMLAVRVGCLGGSRIDLSEKAGLNELLAKCFVTGTRMRTEAQILKETEFLAASLGGSSGRNSFTVVMDSLSQVQNKAADLLRDLLLEREDSQLILDRERAVQIQQIKAREDNPAQVAGRAFAAKMFNGHPYANDPLGNLETMATIQLDDLRNTWKKVFTKNNMVLAVGGKFDLGFWREWIDTVTSKLDSGYRVVSATTLAPLVTSESVFTKSDKEQNHLIVGYRAFGFDDPDRHAIQVMQSILAGMGGRLFMELREKNSLAYTVSPMRMEGLETGYFGTYIGCSPDKTELAAELMLQEFRKLQDKAVPEDELSRSIEYIAGRHAIDEQRTSAQVSNVLYNALYELPLDEVFNYVDLIRSVTAADVQRVAKRIFGGLSVTSLVGTKKD